MAFWRTYYHLVWATKNREPILDEEIEKHLFPFIVSKAGELEMHLYAVNGWIEHMHVVCSIPPKLAVSEAVRGLKGASSRFIAEKFHIRFSWQRGYGVFTLGQQRLAKAISYVDNQKEHHKNQTTNRWLEEITHDNNGPKDKHLSIQDVQIGSKFTLKEPQSNYLFTEDLPF